MNIRNVLVATLALGSLGCVDYTIDTTVNPDGTGVRLERVEVTRQDEVPVSGTDFRALMFTTERRGWTTETDVDEDGDTTWVFERRTDVRDLAAWSDPDRGVRIAGVTPSQARTRIGYVELGDVLFRNSVQLGTGRRSDGTASYSYREAFLWDNGADVIVEFVLRDLDRALRTRYPRLSEAERGAIVGFARARIWVAGGEGLFFGENEDEAIERAAQKTAEHGVKLVRVRYPDADADFLRDTMAGLLAMEDGQAEQLFEETLPGLSLAFNTSMVVRLTLPGRVTSTNADRRDGDTLEWEFSPLDALAAPIELFAESVLGG